MTHTTADNLFFHAPVLKKQLLTIEKRLNTIVRSWIGDREVAQLLARLEIDPAEFGEEFGTGIATYFHGVIRGDVPINGCPKLPKMLDLLFEKNAFISDIVMLCTRFQEAFKEEALPLVPIGERSTALSEANIIFTTNLGEVMRHYARKTDERRADMEAANQELSTTVEERSRSLDEQVTLLNEYKKVVDAGSIVSMTDPKGTITYVNEPFCQISGYEMEELIGKPHNIVRHPDMPKEAFADMWKTIRSGNVWKGTVKNRRKDGSSYYVESTVAPITDSEGNIIEYVSLRQDITELMEYRLDLEKITEEQTRELQKLNRRLHEHIHIVDKYVIISKTDLKGFITYASEAFCAISGYTREELIGQPHNIVRHPDMPKEAFADMWETIRRGETWSGEVKNRKKNGGFYWVNATITPDREEDGTVSGYTSVRLDITARKALETLSVTDSLTKAYNRRKFETALREEIDRNRRYNRALSVIILDIDHFKNVNDTYGHDVGDEVLVFVADTLRENLRISDLFARWGGEEFAVLLPETEIDMAAAVAEKLRRAIEESDAPVVKQITASFGVAQYEEGEDEIHRVVKRADTALYRAKKTGRNRVYRD